MNLATKIILSLLCVFIFFMGGFTYLVGKWQRDQLKKATQYYAMVLGEAISDSISTEMELGRSDKVQGSLERIGKGSPHIRSLRIFNQQGHILRSAVPSEIGTTIDSISLKSHLRYIFTPFEHQISGETLVSFIKPFPNVPQCQKCHDPKEKIIGFLDLDMSMKPILELVSSGERFLLISIGMTLLIVAGSIFLITSRWIQSPLSKVVGAMKRVESGDLDARVNITSRDELGKVSRTFNSMVETLSKTKKDLEILHQRELERVQKMATLGELAAAMAHEIRNPLAGIASAAKIIHHGLEKNDPRVEIFNEINYQTVRLEKIVSNLLQFARTSSPQFSFFDFHEIIDNIILLFSYQMQNQGIQTEKEFQPDLPHIHADPEQIKQVLMNIVLNALQAMPEGGKVQFKTFSHPGDEMVHLIISDTGAGISEETIPKIFKPFYSTKAKGAGLGLAIVEKIIQEHRGKVIVNSQIGMGTTVEITLPTSNEKSS